MTEYLSVVIESVDSIDRTMTKGAMSPTKMKRRGRPKISGGPVVTATMGEVPLVDPRTAGQAGMSL